MFQVFGQLIIVMLFSLFLCVFLLNEIGGLQCKNTTSWNFWILVTLWVGFKGIFQCEIQFIHHFYSVVLMIF